MGTLILIVLLLAALTGLFWTVVKVTAIAVLSLILTVMFASWLAVWFIRRRFRRVIREFETRHQHPHDDHTHGPARGHGGAIPAQGHKHPDPPLA